MRHMQTESGIGVSSKVNLKVKMTHPIHMESPPGLFWVNCDEQKGCELTLDSNSLGAN